MTTKQRIQSPTTEGNPFPALDNPRPVIDAEGVVRYTWDDPKQPGHDAWEREHRALAKANPSKYPTLSKVIRDKKHHVNDQMRIARFLDGRDGGSISAELAFERMLDVNLKDEVRQGWWDRHRRAMRTPDARAVDEKGEPEKPEVNINVLANLASDPATRAALLTLQRALEAGTRVRGGQVVEGQLVASATPGLPEREDRGDVAEATTTYRQDAASPREKRDS